MKTLTITVEYDKKSQTYKIKDDMGNEKTLDCLFILGSGGQDFYMFGGGSPAELANALGEGLARGVAHDQMYGESWYSSLYQNFLKEMCIRTGEKPHKNEITAEEAVRMWEKDEDDKKKFH